MGKDPAMPFYVNDYLSSPRVQSMTEAQELAYIRLCLFCWASGDASLPDNEPQLMAMARWKTSRVKGGSRVVENGWPVVAICFQPHPTKVGFLTHEKVYQLWLERQEWREKSRIGGLNSATKRGKKRGFKGGSRVVQPQGQPNGNPSSSSSSSSSSVLGVTPLEPQESVSSKDQRVGDARGRGNQIDLFEDFWKAYPSVRKGSKGEARKAWLAAVKKKPAAEIIAAAIEYAASPVGTGKFSKGPAPWLNQECWDDDRRAWVGVISDDDPLGNIARMNRYKQQKEAEHVNSEEIDEV